MAKILCTNGETETIKLDDLTGRTVEITRDIETGMGHIPKGTLCVVKGWHQSTLQIETFPCDCCGLVMYARQVPRGIVLLLKKEIENAGF